VSGDAPGPDDVVEPAEDPAGTAGTAGATGAAGATASDDGDPAAATGTPGAAGDGGTEGVQGVQQAAHQMISAARGLLDALEALVDDPATVRDAASLIGGLARGAARMAADAGRQTAHGQPASGAAGGAHDADPGDEPPEDGPVQHIDVR
jgi:hypothetical protein